MTRKNIILFRILAPIPFVIGSIGYLLAGYEWWNALYGAFCYYFVSVYNPETSNFLMEIARWTAPLITFMGIFYSITGIVRSVRSKAYSMRKDAVVIYYDEDASAARTLEKSIPHSFVQEISDRNEGTFFPDVSRQILFFRSDEKNLSFYNDHLDSLKDKEVYLKLFELDSNLLKSSNAHFFNLMEIIGTLYWKKYPLLDIEQPEKRIYEVAIVGSTPLTDTIIKGALLYNIFYQDQSVIYHVYTEDPMLKHFYKHLLTMNNDQLIFEEVSWMDDLDRIGDMDRAILTDRDNEHMLELFLYTHPEMELYYFSESSADPARFLRGDHLHAFGQEKYVLTKENIVDDTLYQKAKSLHYLFVDPTLKIPEKEREAFKSEEWKKLDGFMQTSYRVLTDYYDLYAQLLIKGYPLTINHVELAKLEHVRWCRYYSLNHWKYGVPEDGSPRDTNRRIHRSLVPYYEMCQEDKDREFSRIIFLSEAREKHEKGTRQK